MKNFVFSFTLFLLILFRVESSIAQSTTFGNAGTAGAYLGWDVSTGFPLVIKHENVQPIDFWTSGLQRAKITGPEGFFGISDDWFTFYPDAQIHQNLQDGVDLWHHFTTGRTGLGFNAGFKVGLYDNGTAGWAEAHFEQWHYAPIITMLADASANIIS